MGFIFQEFLLISVLSVYENITFPLSLNNQPIDKHFLRHVVDFLGLSDKLHRMPYQLSGGEQQRTAIARAIITKPKILFGIDMEKLVHTLFSKVFELDFKEYSKQELIKKIDDIIELLNKVKEKVSQYQDNEK